MSLPPAGWYTNPEAHHQLRWWDGNNWTAHIQSAAPQDSIARTPPRVGTTHSTPVEFNAFLHTRELHPPAKGFSEQQLNNVPLITVYPAVIPAIIGAFFLLVGFLGAPYEFYVVLRWAVTSMAIWMLTIASGQKRSLWTFVFICMALLFNPIMPINMTRDFWVIPDIAGAVIFAIAGGKMCASRPATHADKRSF